MLLLTEQLKLITVPSFFRMSVVIIWHTAGQYRTKFLLRHNHLGIRALAYPEGVEGVQPPLNVLNCVFAHKIQYKLCSCVHYILNFVFASKMTYIVSGGALNSTHSLTLNFVQENVKNRTRIYANFTFCFRVCFILLRPRPMARSFL